LKKTYENSFRDVINKTGLTQNEIDILLFLRNNPSMDTAKEISECRAISKSLVSKSVANLLSRGLINVVSDQSDRRIYRLKMTAEAAILVEELHQIQERFKQKITDDLTKEEIAVLSDLLGKIYRKLT